MKQAEIDKMRAQVDSELEEWRKTLTNGETHPEWYLNQVQEVNMAMLGLPSEAIHKRHVCRKCQKRDRNGS